jgi:sugar lactone lactonase YvrE
MTSPKPHPIFNTSAFTQRVPHTSAAHCSFIYTVFFLLIPFCANAQVITTIAGIGVPGYFGDGGLATAAKLKYPSFLAIDGNGNLFFAEGLNNIVRKVAVSGIISTVAGNNSPGFSGDYGPATAAQLNSPIGVAVDIMGNIYIADEGNNRIRKVDVASGTIYTVAGNGVIGFSGDGGSATSASINYPIGIACDSIGNLYIADHNNFRIREVDVTGIITTYAGNGVNGFAGDGTLATTASMSGPNGLAVDKQGNLYIAENRIRKVDAVTKIITTIVGNGSSSFGGDEGPATSAGLWLPYAVSLDGFGNIYIADQDNNRVRQVDTTNIIHTVAGSNSAGYSGDAGLATAAELHYPEGVALDACGNLYITDNANCRIRKITYPPILTTPTITLSGITNTTVGTMVTVTATVTNAGSSYNIEWFNHGIQFTTTTVPYVAYTKPAGTDTITAKVVSTATYGCYDSTTSGPHIITADPLGVSRYSSATCTIYPNPANDLLHIDGIRSPAHYYLSTIVGTILQQGPLTKGNNNIPIHSLPPGMYIIEVLDSDNIRTVTRFIKQ